MKKNFINSIPFNKNNFIKLEEEKNLLKITLKYISEENEKLKNELEDMKITAKKNKEMLQEYVNKITDKDKLFIKMNSQIESLTTRLKVLDVFNKKQKINKERYFGMNTNPTINNNIVYTNSLNNEVKTTNVSTGNYQLNSLTNNNTKSNNNNNNINKSFSFVNQNLKKALIFKNISQKNKINSNIKNITNKIIKKVNDVNDTFDDELKSFKSSNIINNPKDKNSIKSYINQNNKIDINSNKLINEFLLKQNILLEEINNIKDDIQFIKENKSKNKMQNKLNQSIISNISKISDNSQNIIKNNSNFNNSFISNNSSLNSSFISNSLNNSINNSKQKNEEDKKQINLSNRYKFDFNLTNFLNSYKETKNILFLIDNNENIWEIIPRNDLNIEDLEKKNIKNLNSILKIKNNNNYNNNIIFDKLANIQIKEPIENKFRERLNDSIEYINNGNNEN
jgi:hypothetical protein